MKKCKHRKTKFFEKRNAVVCLDCGEEWGTVADVAPIVQTIYVNPPAPVWVYPMTGDPFYVNPLPTITCTNTGIAPAGNTVSDPLAFPGSGISYTH